MEIMNWCILLILVILVPFFLGMIPVKHMNSSQRTPAMTYVCGWFVSFFTFELTAVPFILLEKSFTAFVITYTLLVTVLFVCSVWASRSVWADYKKNICAVKSQPLLVKAGWLVAFLLIGAQVFMAVRYEYYDGDDAYYIATSVLTNTFDTMYLRDAYTGYIYPLDARHALAPTPIYQAWLSRLSGIHPTIVAHSVLSAVWLVFMYCIYGQIGNRLLPISKKEGRAKSNFRPVFLILIALWFAFGNISLYTAETFAMTRTWQGKGMMAGMVLPALVLCLISLSRDKVRPGIWMLYECVLVSAVFATSISFMLIPTIVGVAAVIIGIKKKSVREAAKIFVCCVPCLLLSVCYIVVR
ncbi:MAG: hypothetical protein K2N89_08690 [Lachnospiraceae bacterium]|nr:hypothetical protein [Lachnospiraceae bacterium]